MSYLTRSFGLLAKLGIALVASSARADVPPPPGIKFVPFELTVDGLRAAPDRIMFAYPISASDGAPTFELWVVEDGEPLRMGRRSPTPRLYMMEKSAFTAWRAAHPPVRYERRDEAAASLVESGAAVACDAVIANVHQLPSRRKEEVFAQRFALVEGSASTCITREVSKTDAGHADGRAFATHDATDATDASDADGCALATRGSAGPGGLLAALGVVLVRRRRRSARSRA